MTAQNSSIETSTQEFYFWDMDHTIIKNDCDVSWKEFLFRRGIAPEDALKKAADFYEDYLNNCLDQDAFMDFQLAEFAGQSEAEMDGIAQDHFDEVVQGLIYPEAEKMIRMQLADGKRLCLITATNNIIAKPLAKYLGIKNLIASELEIHEDLFTGKRRGIYCLGQGKVDLMQRLFVAQGGSLKQSHYYGDSNADIVILEQVGSPHAVNPGEKLSAIAQANNWDVLKFNL